MKQRTLRAISRILPLAVCLTVAPVATEAATKIKLTTLAPKGSSYHRSLQRMGQSWREMTGGKVELVIYPGGIHGSEAAMVERMWIDQAQAALISAAGLQEIEPAVAGLQNLPMMFRTLDEVEFVSKKLQPELERRMRKKDFVVLSWLDTGWVRFFSNKPVVRIDDLKKLKLFTWAGDPKTADVMRGAGLRPVPLETADILTGLQTGLIDAVAMPPFYALAMQVHRPAPHMLDLNWAPLVGAMIVTTRAWNGIPEEYRPALREAARAAGAEIQATARREGVQSIETMQAKWDLEVHTVTPEIEAEWRAAAEAAYPQIRGKIVPAEIFDEVRSLLEAYRADPGNAP